MTKKTLKNIGRRSLNYWKVLLELQCFGRRSLELMEDVVRIIGRRS